MRLNATRVRAIVRKELQDYRRNRSIVMTMAVMPVAFVALPIASIFSLPAAAASATLDRRIGLSLLYMLLIPTIVPAAIAAASVAGEREQGTLEPVLTTPIQREEFLLAKGLAAFIPAVLISYGAFAVFLVAVELFAHRTIATAVFHNSALPAQALFTPLLAAWSIWSGIAISARSSDVRTAQQLSIFASLPPLGVVSLLSFNVIQPTLTLAVGLALPLLVIDLVGWRVAAVMFDRERLVTGTRS
ncbi:MAG TPA: ABC transporter permease subunit [Dehalococcoidia bacterium]|nr:ABC transporter permease subunit [Dehalococcoidia bacterium]